MHALRAVKEAENGRLAGGGGGIRTHGRLAPLPIFKTGAFNRSATPPRLIFQALTAFMVVALRFECPLFAHFSSFSVYTARFPRIIWLRRLTAPLSTVLNQCE